MRTYLHLFGGLAPLEFQKRARGSDGASLFDTWDDYVSALGFPDYRLDVPRQTQTNALMVATFERLGVALCDRALEHDWKAERRRGPSQERVDLRVRPARGRRRRTATSPLASTSSTARSSATRPSLAPPQRTRGSSQLYRDHRDGAREGGSEVALHPRRSRLGGRLLRARPAPGVSPLLSGA